MHVRHAAHQQLHKLTRRYPFTRRVSTTVLLVILVWLYVLYWGERTVYSSHITDCDWHKWEDWPEGAAPHHLVLIADPQLVDPHTYPGRPWPLSSLTEMYTDLYMTRNFRRITSNLTPDSVVFLGDLFDGGREWATSKAKAPKRAPSRLSARDVGRQGGDPEQHADAAAVVPETKSISARTGIIQQIAKTRMTAVKRSLDSFHMALTKPHDHVITREEHNLDKDNVDLKAFVGGENGRWAKWGQRQWDIDLSRFTSIFFEPDQLYPDAKREIFPAYDVSSNSVDVLNGAGNMTRQEYATSGGNARRVIASLPGNHDVGFGSGVQLATRDRFSMIFGEGNRVDVLGNHTFVSIDSPSLSAAGQYVPEGGESQPERIAKYEHIWKPTMDFLEHVRVPSARAVDGALRELGADHSTDKRYPHAVTHPHDLGYKMTADELAAEAGPPRAQLPVILLTHIPLYRDPDTDCGQLREKGKAISISAGYQYQNVVTHSLSGAVINQVSSAGDMVHVFSGDDHDYCDIMHRYNIGGAKVAGGSRLKVLREITVKSFSWAMGVRHPGFQLVSLWNPIDSQGNSIGSTTPTIQSHLCLLPDQLGIFIDYAMLFGLTLMILVVRAMTTVLRSKPAADAQDDDFDFSPPGLSLPRFEDSANGTANAFSTPTHQNSVTKGRHRASSSSVTHTSNGLLGVQRSYTSRTRSVSPAGPFTSTNGGTLVEKAGYYPELRWTDPDEDSDEESHVGSNMGDDDTQEKWKRRKRTPGKAWRMLEEFTVSLLLAAGPVVLFYLWLMKNG